MSKSILSRRAVLAGAASASALAVPAAAVAVAAPSLALVPPAVAVPTGAPAPSAPSEIEKLWAKREAARREYEAAHRVCNRLDKVLERRMPDPHPSIVWGKPENDADGLKYWVPDREPGYFKNYIFSGWIEGVLEKACEPKFFKGKIEKLSAETSVFTFSERKKKSNEEPFPFDDKELALQERLRARLELSRAYERKKKRVKRDIGLAAAEQKRERGCDRQTKLDAHILRTPAATRRDLAIKVKIFEHYGDGYGADEIVWDVQRLIVMPDEVIARILASAA